MRKIFISSDLSANSVLHQLANSYELSYASFISFKKIPFTNSINGDCLFFYSKNGVKFFFEQNPNLQPNLTFAAMGSGTADLLNEYGN
jgi:uroporphyrinogen-III synthase